MAYSDFSVFDLRQQFNVQFRAETLFPQLTPIEPTNWLREALRKGQESGFNSEKSRSERLVTPVLMELSDRNHRSFSIYSGMNLDVDINAGLRGECDFIFSFSRIQDFIVSPVFQSRTGRSRMVSRYRRIPAVSRAENFSNAAPSCGPKGAGRASGLFPSSLMQRGL